MPHPIVHAEIRSADPDATRKFFADLLGWTYPDQGAFPGYTFVDTGVPGALYTAISPLQDGGDLVTFFVAVDDVDDAVNRARELGGRVVQEPQHVPGVSFALIADPQGHVVGLTIATESTGTREAGEVDSGLRAVSAGRAPVHHERGSAGAGIADEMPLTALSSAAWRSPPVPSTRGFSFRHEQEGGGPSQWAESWRILVSTKP